MPEKPCYGFFYCFKNRNGALVIMNKIKILLIEDERDICKMLTHVLTKQGYEVAAAFDGIEGLSKVKIFRPALVLLDVNMPRIDGLQILEQLKTSPETSHIHVVMCTARAHIDDVEKALGMGAEGYVAKPFSIVRLLSKIKDVLDTPSISGKK